MVPQALSDIFNRKAEIESEQKLELYFFFTNIRSLNLSFMQLYLDEISDLLNPDGGKLEIRENASQKDIFVENLTNVSVKTLEQATSLINAGLQYRIVGS